MSFFHLGLPFSVGCQNVDFLAKELSSSHEKIKLIITRLSPSDIQNGWLKEVSAIKATRAIVSIPQLILY